MSENLSYLPRNFVALGILLLFPVVANTNTSAQTTNQPEVVAVVNGKAITQSELDSAISAQLQPLLQQIYAIRKAALENLVARAVLEYEAKKKGIPFDELKKQLTAGDIEIPPAQVEQVYLENASAFAAMSPDEAKERLRLDLESQARMRNYRTALSELRKQARVELYLKEPESSSRVTDTGFAIGSKEAAVTIVEFSDFQCPFCRQAMGQIKQVLQTYGSEVRLVFKHLPLGEIHPQAFAASRAAHCAGEQAQFWQYHDALFAANDLSADKLSGIAQQVGLDLQKFKSCSSSEASRVAVLKDVQEAKRLGIEGTPTFFINGKQVRGALAFEDFKNIIERELKLSQAGPRKK